MTLTHGTGNAAITLSDGTRAQPWRWAGYDARRQVQRADLVRSPDAALYDRSNRSATAAVEVDRTYSTPALAAADAPALARAALTAAAGPLAAGGTTVLASAYCTGFRAEQYGCRLTVTYTFEGAVPPPPSS